MNQARDAGEAEYYRRYNSENEFPGVDQESYVNGFVDGNEKCLLSLRGKAGVFDFPTRSMALNDKELINLCYEKMNEMLLREAALKERIRELENK